jgi:outer membrane protein TolC
MGVAAPDDPSVVTLSDTFPVVAPHWTLQEMLSDADQQNPDLNALKAQESSAKWSARSAASQWLPQFNVRASWSGYTQQYTSPQFLVDQAQTQAAARVQGCQSQNAIAAKANAAVNDSILPITDCTPLAYTQAQGDAILASQQAFPFNFTKNPFSVGFSVSMPVPFTDRFNQNLQVSQAEAQADDAHLAFVARQLDVRRAVSQAYYALVTAYQTIGIQDTNRTAANEQLRLATERYRVGSGTFLELLQAQSAQQQAEHDYVNSVYQYHGAVANLEAAVGRSLR